MHAYLMGAMALLLSGAIVLGLSFSLTNHNHIEYGLNNAIALSSTKGTDSVLQLRLNK